MVVFFQNDDRLIVDKAGCGDGLHQLIKIGLVIQEFDDGSLIIIAVFDKTGEPSSDIARIFGGSCWQPYHRDLHPRHSRDDPGGDGAEFSGAGHTPAIPVILVVIAYNFVGDALRDAADPYSA